MNGVQQNNPLVLNMDKSPGVLSETESFFLRNHERFLSINGDKRGTLGRTSPMAANFVACLMNKPAGENYAIGHLDAKVTNELYSWIYNSNGVNYIQRINGDGECEVVYTGCLQLSADPKYSIEPFKSYLKVDKLCANTPGGVRKLLIFTDGKHDIGCIDVESSISTDSFATSFFDLCADPCELIRLCVPDPCGCIRGEFVPATTEDALLPNQLLDTGYKFAYRHIYYDGIRRSIYSDPSTLFYQDSKGCFENGNFPRCIRLRVPIGNPLVEKIEIVFWKNGNWFLYDTIDKYKKYNDSQQYWFERELSEQIQQTFEESDCSFDYDFCPPKDCAAVDPLTIARVFNPIPREAQAMFEIGLGEDKAALAFVNYLKGNCPIDKKEIEKISISQNCDNTDCQTEFVEVIIRAVVHNNIHFRNQPIFRLGGGADNAADDATDTAYFGGLNGTSDGDLELGYGQQFKSKVRNFIVYVEGTEYWAEMKQWKAHANFTQMEEWGVIPNLDDDGTKRRWRRAIKNGEFFYQEAKIKVPRGTRGYFRLTSHESTTPDSDKSTYVLGVFNGIQNYRGNLNVLPSLVSEEEVYFDACSSGQFVCQKIFVIDDNAIDDGLTTKSSAYQGYVKDADGLPVGGCEIVILQDGVGVATSKADHNGFYHAYIYPGTNDPVIIEARVERDCATNFEQLASPQVDGAIGANTSRNITITDESYKDNFFATIKQRVIDCNGAPIAGVTIALSGSKYRTTGSDGYAVFKIRNYSSRNRSVRSIVMNTGGCFAADCLGNCYPCMPVTDMPTPACYQSKPTILLNDGVVNKNNPSLTTRGLKAGGRYEWAVVAKGSCGRQSAAYSLGFTDVPKTQVKLKESFCSLKFTDAGALFPSWVNCVNIVRTENLNPFELQWVIDKIERTDDGKIKLTIQSLNDYNEKYLFKTNTVYQWLAGDRIEFIKNGDGKIFSAASNGILNYLTISPFHDELENGNEEADANFFNQLLIKDDGRLNTLEKGAVIEIQRSKECAPTKVYYSICVSIPVVNGRLVANEGHFETFDTYFVQRKIGEFPLQRFEHHSPSDFWGTRITDIGRGYFENKFENERRYGRNITISPPNEINRFGEIEKAMNPDSHGDIIAVFVQDKKIGLIISENDNSLFMVADDLARVDSSGVVRASDGSQVVSDTQPKVSGIFGCPYELASSIILDINGFVTWYDGYNLIKHNFSQAKAIDIDKCNSFMIRKGQEIFSYNKTQIDDLNKIRVIAGQNTHSGAIHYTFKALRDPAFNNEPNPFNKRNETIVFDPLSEDFLGFASFTAERYGTFELFDDDGRGCAFVSFFQGIPYIHPMVPLKFNEFFGVACDWMIGISLNRDNRKIKEALAIEQQSGNTFFFVKEITTENINFKSEIPAKRWLKDRNKWNSSFLGNINSREGLYGDDKPKGYYMNVLFVRDNTDGLKYNTIDNAKRTAYSELDNIFFKFKILEQSGFTENV